MKKFFTLAAMAFMAMGLNAQTVTLDFESNDDWQFPEGSSAKIVAETAYTADGYTIKVAGSEGNGFYYITSGKYLLFGKQGAYITLPAFDFAVERIEVLGNSGASAAVKQNIFVGEEAVSAETTGAQSTNNYDIAEANQAAGTIYTLKVTSAHNSQVKKINIYKKGEAPEIVTPEAANIAAFKELNNGEKAKLTLADAVVVAAGNKNVIVKDATGAIDFYNVLGEEVKAGDVLNGEIIGKFSLYNKLPQFAADAETDATAVTVTSGTAPTPTVMTVAEAATADKLFELVTIKNVTLIVDGTKYYADEEKALQLYDTFKINYDLSEVTGAVDITGVIVCYNNQIEIAPTVAPTASTTDAINTVTATTLNANAPMYNLAGQQVNKNYKGVVIQNGKKYIK